MVTSYARRFFQRLNRHEERAGLTLAIRKKMAVTGYRER